MVNLPKVGGIGMYVLCTFSNGLYGISVMIMYIQMASFRSLVDNNMYYYDVYSEPYAYRA